MFTNMTFAEFSSRFSTEENCANHLYQVKWPNGFICPFCAHRHAYRVTTRRLPLFECSHCHHQTSLTVGTVIEGSKTPLVKWFIAFFLISQTSTGISASKLSQIIQVTYKTAWLMLHKIRSAINTLDASVQLSGFIQVNQVEYGRPKLSSFQHKPKQHPLLIGASLDAQEHLTYTKIKIVPTKYLNHSYILKGGKMQFREQHIDSDATDINFVLGRCKARKYKKLYSFFAKATQWITTTFHGLGPRYLNSYFNEFCYRLNQQNNKSSILSNLIRLCINTRKLTYAELIHQK